jgi:5-methyltetrahydrofolate--homocysteine methyltransferase
MTGEHAGSSLPQQSALRRTAHGVPVGQAVLGAVQGDLLDIGKNRMGIMLERTGFHLIDLGVNVPPAKFVEAGRAHHPVLLGMSAVLTTALNAMRLILNPLKTDGLQRMVGGAPVTQKFVDEIGADLYAPDAASAASRAADLVQTAVAPANVDHQAGQLGS